LWPLFFRIPQILAQFEWQWAFLLQVMEIAMGIPAASYGDCYAMFVI
jgi:hypothetical protein